MKKIIIPMLALAAGVAFTSCESELDIPQKGVIDLNDFYKTDEDCQKALASAYEGFLMNTLSRTELNGGPGIYTPAKVLANHPGDDINYGGGNYGDHEFGGDINQFRLDADAEAVNFHYRGLYLSIYTCNYVIEKFDRADATPFMKQAVAEAKVLRAYDQFLLACYWGTAPIVDHLLPADAMPTNSNLDPNFKLDREGVFEWVAKQCEDAAANLTVRKDLNDKNGAVRVTQGFAYALAGKAHMFAKNWDAAKTDLEKVINSGKYDLVDGDQYLDLFHIEGDGCKEKVFEVNFEYNPAISDWGGATWNGAIHHSTWMEANCFNWRAGNFAANPAKVYCGIDGWGSIGVPQWFGDEFFANDGHSKRFDATLMHIDDAVYMTTQVPGMTYEGQSFIFETDNKAEYDAMMKDLGDVVRGKGVEKVITATKEGEKDKYNFTLELKKLTADELKTTKAVGIKDVSEGLYGQSFWLPFKNIMRRNDVMKPDGSGLANGDNNRFNNIIVMRYAEVLLNYAEVCLMKGDAATAKTYINKIQQRAGSKTISGNVDMEVLKREKSYELWFEGCRFQDVMRWQDPAAIARLEKAGTKVPHLFDKLYRPVKSGDVDVTWEHGTEANSRFYTVHTQEAVKAGKTVGFKKGKHELFPFPGTVVSANPSIKQNPGF